MKRHGCGTLMVQTRDAIGRVRDRCPKCHGVAPVRSVRAPTSEPRPSDESWTPFSIDSVDP